MVVKPWEERARARWDAWQEKQFPRLAFHFFEGFFASDMAADSDNSLSMGAVFALLAVPGLLIPLFLLEKYSTLTLFLLHRPRFNVFIAAIPDRFFFVNFSIAVTGIVTVLKWDSLFPDRRDFANLAVMPIPLNHLLYAKALALAVLMAMFAADINIASTFVFPFVVVVSAPDANTTYYLEMVMSHGMSVVLASVFTFLFFLALAGLLMSALPWRWFQRVSRYVRVMAIVALLAQFLTSFALAPELNRFGEGSPLHWLPPVWFTGLGQALMNRGGNPHLLALGGVAWRATTIASILAAICYVASYRRHFLRIPESLDVPAGLKRRHGAWVAAWAARTITRNPFERACTHFALWTLFRSEKHTLFLSAYLGLGLTLAGQTPSDAPLILAFFVLMGLRFLFELPAELRSNWMFQVAAGATENSAAGTARRVMLLFTLIPLGAIALPFAIRQLGWLRGAVHVAFLALVIVFFTEVLLVGYRKIPFTCSRVPGKRNPAVAFTGFVAAFLIFVNAASSMDAWILARPWRLLVVAVVGRYAWKIAKIYLENLVGAGDTAIFEEVREPAVHSLRIA